MMRAELETSKVRTVVYSKDVHEKQLLAVYDSLIKTAEGQKTLRSRYGFLVSKDEFIQTIQSGLLHRIVLLDTHNKIIGWAEYFLYSNDTTRAELSRLILPEHQGKGLGSLLLEEIIQFCFRQESSIRQIHSITMSGNSAAIRSLTKLQGKYKGIRINLPDMGQVEFIFFK